MKKFTLGALAVLVIGLSACQKDLLKLTSSTDSGLEKAQIQAIIKKTGLNPILDSTGVYYQVVRTGKGAYPTSTSLITGALVGKLADSTTVDSSVVKDKPLSSLLKGVQIGVTKVNAGGRVVIIVPSSMGYGEQGSGKVPGNSVLVYAVDLKSFKQQ